jgi:hypothetical protein
MSRGLGQIERLILDEIAESREPSYGGELGTVLINSHTLSLDHRLPGYQSDRNWQAPRARRQAVVRALHSFVRKFPRYALIGGQGRRCLYLYDTTDPLSVFWARLSADRGFVTWSEARGLMRERDSAGAA